MEYEYGTGQQGLNYPNPYKIENIILAIRMSVFLITSIVLFVIAKIDLNANNFTGLALNLFVALCFLSGAITTGYKMSQQLRVYFGRGQPRSLAPEISPDLEGITDQALHLKETIRQGALNVMPPPGNLNGFLYHHLKNLIIAPPEIQALTQHSFSNVIKILIISSLFALSSFFGLGSHAYGWLGLYFFIIVLHMIIAPLLKKEMNNVDLSITGFWKLLATSLVVPIILVIVGKQLPDISEYYFGVQSLTILLLTIGGELLLLRALYYQLENPTGITTAFEQEAITFNAPPSQLVLEIERKLQNEWIAKIPNRIYSRILPKIANGRTDNFKGQVIQETQPMAPKALSEEQTLNNILADVRKKYLFYINSLALLLNIIGTIGILDILYKIHSTVEKGFTPLVWIPLFLGIMSLGIYLIKMVHNLWGRFDFESTLYIFDLEGNYSTAEVNFGNYMKDTFHTKKDIVNIEAMTFRVWVTHLRTCVFGHGINSEIKPRRITNMIGLKEESKAWLQTVKKFAEGQSIIVAPTSQEDIKRANAIAQLNAVGAKLNEDHQRALSSMVRESSEEAIATLNQLDTDLPPMKP